MRLSNRSAYFPRLSIGLKKYLVELNLALDAIKWEINRNADYGFYFDHSVQASEVDLTPIETMILFLEDRRFFRHWGFELRVFPRSLKRLMNGKRLGGISTIEQQVVRIITKKNDRSISRKLNEVILALLVNFHCSKKRIFDYYIHNAYMGYKLEGCEVSAKFVFGKPAKELDWEEASFIASLLPLPLPKQVHQYIEFQESKGEIITPTSLIKASFDIAPNWAYRVNARYDFALRNQDFKPSSR